MIFTETPLKGAYIIDIEPIEDNRGFFSRTFCIREFEDRGLPFKIVQCNMSYTKSKNTLRGLHYQTGNAAEIKVFRCIEGSLLDVIVDMREESETFGQHFKMELSSQNARMIYIPKGFAHGFLTLEDNTRAFYMVSEFYSGTNSAVIRWNDPYFNIDWTVNDPILSKIDANHPNFEPQKK